MLIVLSPAKSLDFATPPGTRRHTQPRFLDEAEQLVSILRELSLAEVAELMDLSDPLAALNVARYGEWRRPFTAKNAKQALLAFNGDVYAGLQAATLGEDDLAWAQARVRMLSGLYGVLRPLDLMQPYRLEMGTRLSNPRGKDLYAWWDGRVTEALNADLQQLKVDAPVLVNCASAEYFKAVRPARLKARLVTPVFQDWKGGWKIVSFHAKRARGLMARYAIDHRVDEVEALKEFDREGYAFDAQASEADTWVFRRPPQGA